MKLCIWDAQNSLDRQNWLALWNQWPDREVFAHPDYLNLYATDCAKPMCIAASDGETFVLFPFLLRALAPEPWCPEELRDCVDITSPYGYGGPFCWGASGTEFPAAFWSAFDQWARSANVISEIVRFTLFPETTLEYPGARRYVADNVVRSLAPESLMWNEFEHKVRKNVKRARSTQLKIQVDTTGARLDEFFSIYNSTMDRRNAVQNYYFRRDFFEQICSHLSAHTAWFHALVDDVVVSTELVLVSANRVYSFLGGTNAAWFHVRPNDLLKLEIMNWAFAAGKSAFVLGGGYGLEDGILRYKLSFAPSGKIPFCVGSRIFNTAAYEAMTESRRAFAARNGDAWVPQVNYFPAYRG